MNISRILRDADPSGEEPFSQWLRSTLSPLLFWSAVLLPVLYIPLILLGPETNAHIAVVVTLLLIHILSIVVGHSYSPDV